MNKQTNQKNPNKVVITVIIILHSIYEKQTSEILFSDYVDYLVCVPENTGIVIRGDQTLCNYLVRLLHVESL